MKKITLGICLALSIAGCSSTQSGTETATTKNQVAEKKSEQGCRYIKPTGSRMKKKVCSSG